LLADGARRPAFPLHPPGARGRQAAHHHLRRRDLRPDGQRLSEPARRDHRRVRRAGVHHSCPAGRPVSGRMTADLSAVEVGTQLPPWTARITRKDRSHYAGASLDFRPNHWSDRQATECGLPGVIAHGMLAMALAGRLVTEWAGDAGRVIDLFARFTRPVVVPDDDTGAEVELTGKVTEVADGKATVAVPAKSEGPRGPGKPTAVARI